jgi:biotin carboxylase
MDFLYISPEFPPYSEMFVQSLNRQGIRVWGVGETDFYDMPAPLRAALRWYVRTDLNDPDAVRQAVERLLAAQAELGLVPHIDRVESHNEQWLRLEGLINADFGIPGVRPGELDRLKKKSAMKSVFKASGFPVAEGGLIHSVAHGLELAEAMGFPLILKPDEGVGAGGIYRVENRSDLEAVMSRISGPYLIERFIHAPIVTYDGLTDGNGQVVFENSLTYGDGVLEYVLGKDTFFYVNRRIPIDLAEAGRSLVAAFDIRGKFFHFEFFRVDGAFWPIEINCRPPGGPILDMMNFSADVDLYDAYACMVTGEAVALPREKKYYCAYMGRRERDYAMSHEAIVETFGAALADFAENPPLFQQAMGRWHYILRSSSEEEILGMAERLLAPRAV